MADTYAILGFSGECEPVVLFESNSAGDCDRWAKGYTQSGDWGGYSALALYEVAPWESADNVHTSDAPILTYEEEAI